MGKFDRKGMLLFPNSKKKEESCNTENLIVYTDCYCPNGHDLISSKAKFKDFNGIMLKISKADDSGMVALSPIYGCKTRVSIDIDLKEGELYKLHCPECEAKLPFYSKCHCGGNIATLFLNEKGNFNSFIGVCNRIGCTNSYIQNGEELITSARLQTI